MSANSPKTIFVSGFFNVLHPGHLRLLRFAREMGDRLIVGVLADSLARDPITIGEDDRLEAIKSLRMVDESLIVRNSAAETIQHLRPDIVVKGREHLHQANSELEVLSTYGGRLVFSSGDSFLSSTDLIRHEMEKPETIPVTLPLDFMKLHDITRVRLTEIIRTLADVNVLVIGDSIVDEYISCHPLGMSREDPTLVVTPIETRTFVGGAGIVAAHAASIGGMVSLHTVAGADEQAEFLSDELHRFGVNLNLHTDDNRPTTIKQRWRAAGKTLLRVSHLHQDPISLALQDSIFQRISQDGNRYTLLIFSDFNYGVLPQPLVDRLTAYGRQNEMFMAADSQASSQIGDISRFVGVDLVTPTEFEARMATRNFEDGLIVLADQLRQQTRARSVMMTLGDDGVILRGPTHSTDLVTTEKLPALNSSPRDVAGAGDALLVVSSMALAIGASLSEAGLLGSLAAALQVSTTGNVPIRAESLLELIES